MSLSPGVFDGREPGKGHAMSEDGTFGERLGAHLRRLRKQKGLSLLDVEAASSKEFKASVLGAYERGERAISAARLSGLAKLYRLPLQAMLPPDGGMAAPAGPATGVALDLGRVEVSETPEARAVARYVRLLQADRGEWGGPVFSIRATDVRALGCALDLSPEELLRRLEELGLRAY